jgi:preprotein translocase subunit YajC
MIWIVVMIAVFWLVLIRPQQKRAKKQQEMIGGLKRGDKVITSGGIYGRVIAIEGPTVTLEIAKNTQIKLLKSHVAGTASEDTEKELDKSAQSGDTAAPSA